MTALLVLFVVMLGLGVVLFARQLRFGTSAQRLAKMIDAEGGFDRSSLPRNEKGRVEHEAALAEIEKARAVVEADPDDWRAWFRLGVAYGDANEPQDARAAVRRAVMVEHLQRRQDSA